VTSRLGRAPREGIEHPRVERPAAQPVARGVKAALHDEDLLIAA
jgi:hypothetical protein